MKKILPSRKTKTAGEFGAVPLGEMVSDTPKPWQSRLCQRGHRWVKRRFNRRCVRCGLEETNP